MVLDWDELHEAETASSARIRKILADEVRPYKVNEEFIFPVAEGDLNQLDEEARIVKRKQLRKEAKEARKAKEQADRKVVHNDNLENR